MQDSMEGLKGREGGMRSEEDKNKNIRTLCGIKKLTR